MGVYLSEINMPKDEGSKLVLQIFPNGEVYDEHGIRLGIANWAEAVPVSEHGRLKKRVVYRGDVFNALESARIIALDGILTDRYKDGFHDGLKRALEILANEVQDVPTVVPASEEDE